MRRKPWRRWLVFGLVGVLGTYVVADVVMMRYLESRGAAELAKAMTAERAEARLGSFPFLPSFFTDMRPEVETVVHGATAPGGLRVARVEILLRDVRYSSGRMFSLIHSRFAPRTVVHAGDVIARVNIRSADLAAYLRGRGVDVDKVRVTTAGVEVTFTDPDAPAPAPAATASPAPTADPGAEGEAEEAEEETSRAARYLPRVEKGRFRLQLISAARVRSRFRDDAAAVSKLVALPRFPGGLRTDIRLSKGVITIEATGPTTGDFVEKSIGEAES